MKFKFLLNEADESNTGGGSGTGAGSQGTGKGPASSEGNNRDGDSDSSDSSGSPDRGEPRAGGLGGILTRAIEKAEAEERAKDKAKAEGTTTEGDDKKEKDDDKKTTSQEDGGKKKVESKEESNDEEDFDENQLITDGGRAPSPKVSKFIKGLKGKLTQTKQELEALKSKSQLTENNEEYEKLKAEHAALKTKFDDHFFEQSDGYKEAFIKPVQETSDRIAQFFTDLKPEETKELRSQFDEIVQSAYAGKKSDFYKKLDKIVDEFLPDAGRSSTSAFTKEMEEFYDVCRKQHLAASEKSETRKKLAEAELEQRRSKNMISIDSAIERHIKAFEVAKAPVLMGLKGKDLEEYKSMYVGALANFKKHMNAFAVTGQIPEELAEIMSNGVTAKALEHENKMGWTAYKMVNQKVDALKEENEELKKKLAKFTSGPGSGHGSYGNSDRSSEQPKKRIMLGDIIRQAR